MTALYTAKVHVTGGRAGHVKSNDGLLDLKLALPVELGGAGKATNPEQLFAAGYGACFESAIRHVAKLQSIDINDVSIDSIVELYKNDSGFKLEVQLDITIHGIALRVAEELVNKAHQVCPYSQAVKGNIDVVLKVNALQ